MTAEVLLVGQPPTTALPTLLLAAEIWTAILAAIWLVFHPAQVWYRLKWCLSFVIDFKTRSVRGSFVSTLATVTLWAIFSLIFREIFRAMHAMPRGLEQLKALQELGTMIMGLFATMATVHTVTTHSYLSNKTPTTNGVHGADEDEAKSAAAES